VQQVEAKQQEAKARKLFMEIAEAACNMQEA
jgi:hypothetical protein